MARRRVLLLLAYLGSLGYHKAYGIDVYTEKEHVTAREFEEAILSCIYKVKKETSIRVEWKKVRSSGVSFVYYNRTFVGNFTGRAEMWNSNIRLRNVTRQDAGKYRCEISAATEQGQDAAETEVSLSVLVPPALPVCVVPSSAMSGTVTELRCKENEGFPASKYRWYRNGIALLESTESRRGKKWRASYTMNTTTGTLLFNPVSNNDTGEYYCEAANGIGPPKKCLVKRMQVASCGLGVYYAQTKGYFSKRNSSEKKNSKPSILQNKSVSILHQQSSRRANSYNCFLKVKTQASVEIHLATAVTYKAG
ncbi:junctional adhesion molecule B isoform X2 [Eublepharis macularius]|uniref:Junctional adhesion molecule B isoform X2 n=1 Tax=Eublepharis macularius TaxID=481883 RepID=A0AA97J3W1_EUBMA|nr:junctional adhesion molecule B isoform X2 [Eublepharis macularius]